MADIKETYGAAALAKLSALWLDPDHVTLVGITATNPAYRKGVDILVTDAKGMAEYAHLADPDRLASPPSDEFVASIIRHQVKSAVTIVKVGGRTCVDEGRQRIMGARLANAQLRAKGDDAPIRVPALTDKGDDPIATMVIGNEGKREDSIPAKARKAQRLAARGYTPAETAVMFGHKDGQTLKNWDRLLKCTPEILADIEAGKYPVSIGYELGKLERGKQAPALATILSEGGTMKGAQGRENVKAAAELVNAPAPPAPTGNGLEGTTVNPNGAPVPAPARAPTIRATTRPLSKTALRELANILEPAEGKDGPEYPDGNAEFAHLFLCVILGDDATGEGIEGYPSVHKFVKKYLRSGDA